MHFTNVLNHTGHKRPLSPQRITMLLVLKNEQPWQISTDKFQALIFIVLTGLYHFITIIIIIVTYIIVIINIIQLLAKIIVLIIWIG